MTVRDRRPADLPACVAALRAVHLADGYPLRWPPDPAEWLSPARLGRAWVAELPDIGLAGHVAVLPGQPAELSRLFVVPAARRRGVAEALVAQAVSWAGLPLTLDVVDEGRSRAIAFYESRGWKFTHTSVADWTGPDAEPVRLRHYRLSE